MRSRQHIPSLYGTIGSIEKTLAANPEATTLRLSSKISPRTLALALSKTKAKRLIVSPTVERSLNPGVKSALKKVGVALLLEKNTPGRLKSHSIHSRFRKARRLVSHGTDVAKACEKTGISRRTYYYVLKSGGA
ncbi:MAG TPA: hypothetical protein PLO51_03520 [Candidatus Micrarchaeota archaeon]|nr:hypothetical protein [Candidatus Micrarchaeota archaeon]